MNPWERLISEFPEEERPTVAILVEALHASGTREIGTLAALDAEQLVMGFAAALGEDPITALGNPQVVGFAGRILEAARRVLAGEVGGGTGERPRSRRPGRRAEPEVEVEQPAGEQPTPPQKTFSQLKGRLTTESGIPLENARLTAWVVTVDNPVGVKLGDYIGAGRSADWSIHFDLGKVAGNGASPAILRPHLRFQIVREGRGGRERSHTLLRFSVDLSQPIILTVPNSYYPEIERVESALARLSGATKAGEDDIQAKIVAAEEHLSEEAFDAFDQAQAEAALTGLPIEIVYGLVRARALPDKPNSADDETLLRLAVSRGYVGDEVVQPKYLEQVYAWRRREAEAEKEAERRRHAREEAEQEQRRREAEIAEKNRREEHARRAAERLLRPDGPGSASALGANLKEVELPDDAQLAYARILLDARGAPDEVVDERLESAGIGVVHRETIQRVRDLTALIGNHPPLFAHIWQELRKTGGREMKAPDLSAFARRTADDWDRVMTEEQIEPPDEIGGPDLAARRREYARTLELRFDRLYPRDALIDRLSRQGELAGVQRLLVEEHPGLDLRAQPLPATLLGATSPEAEKVRGLQRLVCLAPASDAVALLGKKNVSSASEIAALPRTSFLNLAKEAGIDEERAGQIHDRAVGQSAQALAVVANIAPGLHVLDPGAVRIPFPGPSAGEPSETAATLETLFGPEGACAVKNCQSVLGMPAYFFDLLEEVKRSGEGVNLLDDVLFSRRPDLGEIELSCENSETRLPYVDLVNEILERVVANKSNAAPYPQTTWNEDDLAASPEHLEEEAYKILRLADYPWSLPFSLAHEEARTYLSQLGTSLVRLIELLNPPSVGDLPDPRAPILAGEYLGMTSREVEYFAESRPEPEAPFWGFDQNHSIGWSGAEIRGVREFLERAGVSWLELLDLILSDYINPGHELRPFTGTDAAPVGSPVRIKLGEDPCDLSTAQLVGLQAGFLRRFRLFVRLWRRLGWTVREVDRALSIFGGNLTRVSFIHIADIQRLRDSLQLPVESILSFFGDIDVQTRWDGPGWPSPRQPSQFVRLFLDRSALAAPQREFLATALNGGGPPSRLSDQAGSVRAVLGLSEADFLQLTDTGRIAETIGSPPAPLGFGGQDWANVFVQADELTVGNLSRLFRAATLARALRISIAELLRFRAITGIDPFSAPYETLDFGVALERQRAAGFTVAELDYLLRDRGQLSEAVAANRGTALDRLKAALRKVQPTGEFHAGQDDLVCSIVAKALHVPTPVAATLVNQFKAQNLGAPEFATSLLSVDAARQSAAQNAYIRIEKAVYVIRKLRLVVDESSFPVVSEGEELRPCAAFDWTQLPVEPLVETNHQRWLRFTDWRGLIDLVYARDRLAAQNVSLWQVREAARAAAEAAGAGDAVGASWQAAGMRLGATPPELLALTTIQAQLLNGAQWRRIIEALELVRTLRVSVTTAKAWVSYDPAGTDPAAGRQDWLTLAEALEIRNAARARHDADSWKKVARGLRGLLREKQRKALAAYLCARDPGAPTAMELYGKYLVDVEMGAQQDTTRIELAVASVQLFIQRVLLGSEKKDGTDLAFNAEFTVRWEWMKRYQSWANSRRVFLYPENYLRSDLRSDKSSLFVEAEEALAQRELRKENLEEIVADYVAKLEEIARLEVVGTCMEEGRNDKGGLDRSSLLHIVARTNGHPQVYYHRTWDDKTGQFTGWRKIDLSIDGEWVFPIVRDGRLTLFWIKHEKDIESLKDTVGLTSAQPFPLQPHFPMFQDQYRLSWSTLYRGKWMPKKTTEKLIARPFLPFMEAKFAVRVVGDRVRISGLTVLQPDIAKSLNG